MYAFICFGPGGLKNRVVSTAKKAEQANLLHRKTAISGDLTITSNIIFWTVGAVKYFCLFIILLFFIHPNEYHLSSIHSWVIIIWLAVSMITPFTPSWLSLQ